MRITDEKLPKQQMRKQCLELRGELTAKERKASDVEIISRLLCTEEYSRADMILTYVSVGDEPDTIGLIHAAFANGKKVAVPKCMSGNTMEFYLIASMDDLKEGKYGLLEPDESKCKKAELTESCICVVPGLAFDAKGYRLGRGGGYYDRFLKDFKGISMGVCYQDFFRLELEHQAFDVAVDIIVTENFVRVVNGL